MKYATILLTFIFHLKSFSCDCSPHQKINIAQEKEFKCSDNVIVGDIIAISKDMSTIRLKVLEVFKGDYLEHEIIELNNNLYCGPSINQLGKWIIYLSTSFKKQTINNCGVSRSFSNPEKSSYYTLPPIPRFSKPEAYDSYVKAVKEKLHNKAISDLKRELIILRKSS